MFLVDQSGVGHSILIARCWTGCGAAGGGVDARPGGPGPGGSSYLLAAAP